MTICILWSRTSNKVSIEEGQYKANHFVPLIKKGNVDISCHRKTVNHGTKKKTKVTKTPKRKPVATIVSVSVIQQKVLKAAVSNLDIADVFKIRNSLSPREKIELKYKIFQSPQTFHFPKTGQFSCKYNWVKNNEYLMYSLSNDALYCFACVVMGVTTRSNLTKESGMRCWKMATTKIRNHFNNDHKALEDFNNLTLAVRDPSRSIDVTANRLVSTLVQRNREMIRPIIATLICLGKCNLAIRGHQDDSKYYLGENTSNS